MLGAAAAMLLSNSSLWGVIRVEHASHFPASQLQLIIAIKSIIAFTCIWQYRLFRMSVRVDNVRTYLWFSDILQRVNRVSVRSPVFHECDFGGCEHWSSLHEVEGTWPARLLYTHGSACIHVQCKRNPLSIQNQRPWVNLRYPSISVQTQVWESPRICGETKLNSQRDQKLVF